MRAFGVIVLAAGGSSRLGRPKQLLPFRGKTLLRHAAETAVDTGAAEVVVVVGREAEEVSNELEGLKLQIVLNAEWQTGIASSIKTGIKSLSPNVKAGVIVACDQPHITSQHLKTLADAVLMGGSPIAASKYQGVLGIPCAFARDQFPKLLELSGEEGAKNLIRRDPKAVSAILFEPAALDIDTEADYRQAT